MNIPQLVNRARNRQLEIQKQVLEKGPLEHDLYVRLCIEWQLNEDLIRSLTTEEDDDG
ncbi:hypothetical protein UFOVP435_39 [uncultured Caudovirales phage]|uniref:Uncharacterized protein n=1 Tax=uncultured Caudovirales phage TaxID=2100421 RepID=A0A6J5M8F3_9CAUD|nr:hypothetical protein UFOVP435_39 [uncultured Caudovirales phage]